MDNVKTAQCLSCARESALEAGRILYENWQQPKAINQIQAHDIKLKLDVQTQQFLALRLQNAFPEISILGEEADSGNLQSPYRWVIDPIDGTVNYTFDIPHACISIALQERQSDYWQTVLGLIHDPFLNETWEATSFTDPTLNGKPISVSHRSLLKESVVSIGFAKLQNNLNEAIQAFTNLTSHVCKIRIMGSAALDLAYIACGRLDAYIETGLRLWDIAAGGYILQRAGGTFDAKPIIGGERESYRLIATNGKIDSQIIQYLS